MPNNLDKYADAVYKCIRCGACRAVCPTFGEDLIETAVARGRMALVEAVINGDLSLTPAFEKAMFHCAMCGACKAGCPSGVDVPGIIEAARAELVAKKKSEPLTRFLARKSLKDKAAMDRAFAMMALGRAAYGPLAATPLAKYLPYQYKDFKRNFPAIPSKPLSARVPALSKAKESKGKVAFFAGCVINYIYPEIGESAIKVVNAAGYDVVMVKEELCCGKPLKSLGEVDAFKSLAERTVKLFGGLDVEAVLTACPTCALTLKEDYPKILPDSEAAATFAGKVRDANHFLVTHSDLIRQLGMAELKVTYHDPCHLNFGLNVRSEPRQLVDAATCGGLVEMPEATRCCGFGGSFSFLDYELSGRIAHRKAANIISTGASVVATACPGCMMHIRDALKQSGSDIGTLHTLQVIEKALK
jgi:glycolate dehydrogenase iron-sulfur subunit